MKALQGRALLQWWRNVKGITLEKPVKHIRQDGSIYYFMKATLYDNKYTTIYLEGIDDSDL